MKSIRFISVIIAVAMTALQANAQFRVDYSDLEDSETISAFKSHVGYLASTELEGRKAGSEGEKAAAFYVYDVLKSYGLEMLGSSDGDFFGMAQEAGDTLVSRNIEGVVKGYDHSLNDRYIVVGARLDNLGVNEMTLDGQKVKQIYYGANGDASGLAIMMELARLVSSNSVRFRRSVIFVAFGASCQSMAGSWYMLNRSFPDISKIDAMIDLDMLGTGSSSFCAYTASNTDMNAILNATARDLQPLVPQIITKEPFPADYRSFYSKEIPSVVFTTGLYPEYNTYKDDPSILDYKSMESELEYIFNFTCHLANVDDAPQFRQNVSRKTNERTYSWNDCDVKPTFMGHADPKWFLVKWVYSYIKYPKEALQNGIQGRVNVEFAIDKNGSVTDIKVTKGVDPQLDAEAVKVIAASPDWKPGKIGGQAVKSYISLPVDFKLEKKGTIGFKKN